LGLHDKLFKQVISEFVPEFLALLFPADAAIEGMRDEGRGMNKRG
jgi:hypothetical protein